MPTKTIATLTCLSALFTVTSASGVTIAEYLFDNGSQADSANDPTVIASIFTETWANDAGFSTGSGNAFAFVEVIDDTIAESIVSGEYFTFNVDPDGSTLDLVSLDFSQITTNAQNVLSGGTFTVAVFSDKTGFTDGDELETFQINASTVGAFTEERSIALSGVSELQGLTTTTEFRFYFATPADYIGSELNGNMRLDNVVLTSIPEPGAYALFAGLLAGAMLIIRRRKA